jgi:hypothetical protein
VCVGGGRDGNSRSSGRKYDVWKGSGTRMPVRWEAGKRDCGGMLLVVVVNTRLTAPSGSVLVSEMPLGGTTVVSVLFLFLLRLFRECVDGGVFQSLGGHGCW